jgi:hypothetical protein
MQETNGRDSVHNCFGHWHKGYCRPAIERREIVILLRGRVSCSFVLSVDLEYILITVFMPCYLPSFYLDQFR